MGSGWKWYLGWVVLGLSLLVAAMASGFLAMRYTMRKEIAMLPSVVGLKLADAKSRMEKLGLRLEVSKSRPTANTPTQTILSQHPAEGTPIKTEQTVSVIISSGKVLTPIPQLTGASLRIAEIQLAQAGYQLGHICIASLGEENSSEIIRQYHSGSAEADSIGPVDLLINAGPPEKYYLMPELQGKEINSVVQLFERYGLAIKEIRYVSFPGSHKGMICSQIPPAGSRLGAKDPILLEAGK